MLLANMDTDISKRRQDRADSGSFFWGGVVALLVAVLLLFCFNFD